MGRLLRKKPASKKKKAKTVQAASSGLANTTVTASSGTARALKSNGSTSGAKPAVLGRKSPVLRRPQFLETAIQFLREVRIELKKVTWPSRKQAAGSTVVVIVLVMIISLFLGVVDLGLSGVLRLVLH
ncbi:preprotein translocase subunit SecE [Thermodesulfobacteriota bacterium]